MKKRESGRSFFPSALLKVAAVLVYIVFVWLLAKPFAGWLALPEIPNKKGLTAAAGYDGDNARYYYLLGRYYDLNIGHPDLGRAARCYRRAVSLSPLEAEAWVGLSNAYRMSGEKGDAEYSLERAVRLDPTDPDLMWKAATFWLIEGSTGKAVSSLKRYILLSPDEQRRVYDLCRKLSLGDKYLLASLVPPVYSYRRSYLEYLMGVGSVNEARDVWHTIDQSNVDQGLFLDYVDFLIANRLYGEAGSVWNGIMTRLEGRRDKNSLVWNAGFEHEIMNGGFDWVVKEGDGVDVYIDDSVRMIGTRSLGMDFDGRHNPGITIARQIVRVSPGVNYTLGGYIKTESLTTDNGIFLSVNGYKCGPVSKRSEAVTGTNFWKKVTVDFRVPDDCGAVVIGIQRARSNKLDNKISGSAWIDGITLRQGTDTPMTASAGR